MKLRNKKTGEITDLSKNGFIKSDNDDHIIVYQEGTLKYYAYDSLAELNEEWEDDVDKDVLSKDPLIKDEKIRKIVRALFDVWEVEDVKIDSNKYFLVTTIEAIGKGWKLEIPSININGVFKPTELCGEGEE